ncbi:hypothetical protein BCR44DRAFT_1033605 [Catenaria anguillulae PL171]|uniref:Uncharacterized protein n=1 Tax=Catenaria anguillulae PL171 TaxID=765915 RepID=A0A1Y2HUM3_9FUNG|nr:hypothetical protein BCR44DRAFT_1033605 [Catenaria anguillulae PL171]
MHILCAALRVHPASPPNATAPPPSHTPAWPIRLPMHCPTAPPRVEPPLSRHPLHTAALGSRLPRPPASHNTTMAPEMPT